MNNAPDLSVVIFAGRQGHALHGTFLSVERAVIRARETGASVDITVALHDADEATREWLAQGVAHRCLEIQANCLGAARNAAREAVNGRYLAFLDGGELWSGTFLEKALNLARGDDREQVLRPAVSLGFADRYYLQPCYTTRFIPEPDDFEPSAVLDGNPYPTTFLADRRVLKAVPFPHVDIARGWNAVDWWWCANLLGASIEQVPVPGTVHYHPVTSHGEPPAPGRLGPTWLERPPGRAG
ncbi:hypothetical protein F0A17_08220 [Billgrantia pellis]|uniref:Glycosyltransferase n=1 Tax=Billgrantia pellis TaxID=2606936 RepID=A0A7V7KI14_9GAMM|nr:hypothetical protein [Halomonas pellis]KAA0012906.1 hypothetical protein F0A17_08220 [Halomonas pellis]